MNNHAKANLLLILTGVALLWHAVMLFTSMPVVKITSEDGDRSVTVYVQFDKTFAKTEEKTYKKMKLRTKERYRLYAGSAISAILYTLMFGFLLRHQQHWGSRNPFGATMAGARLNTLQNVLFFLSIAAIVNSIWLYFSIKGNIRSEDVRVSMGSGVYLDVARCILLGIISIIRLKPIEGVFEGQNTIPGPLSAPPPPPALPPGSIACPACRAVQAQDSRFCKSCGRPLAQPCPKCQALVGPDARFCPKCGHSTAPTCPKCKNPIDPSGRFCEHCGASNGDAEPPPSPPPVTDTKNV